MIYGYGRVSTKGQAKDGNSLEAQERLLKEHGAEVIYMDSFTGMFFAEVKCRLLQNAMYVGCCKIDLGGYTPKPL
ncbi:hypothetical protein [Acetivibrio ethanolgignens]|uniref:Resolvase/invertase-type recombinase catalytic domain-containing protein n=1 Tax=Acetivibrio ethanolgignens TaxID=290052 RepID=A0A0V8QGW4_9FIRM|nr:hypothetical protein [Acetivibrio ethanolgignens]KSV59462.1 hypothetical protein ASU35_18160 [Acetivibrio ethanolgignens]